MDLATLKEQAERCRRLARQADPFTEKRLLDLAAEYEAGVESARGGGAVIRSGSARELGEFDDLSGGIVGGPLAHLLAISKIARPHFAAVFSEPLPASLELALLSCGLWL